MSMPCGPSTNRRARAISVLRRVYIGLSHASTAEIVDDRNAKEDERAADRSTDGEFALAQKVGAGLIGINNRDLHTFVTDIAVTERLLAGYAGEALIVAESGIDSPDDIRRLDAAGARAFLIGESLLKGASPGAKLGELMRAL